MILFHTANRWAGYLVLLPCMAVMAGRAKTPLTFEEHVRPILKAHCFDCHGEGEKLKGGLDLRLRRFIVQGGDSGTVIVPGKPAESLLVELISKGEMPKREKKLSALEIEMIRSWIAAGAKTARPEPAEVPSGMIITEEERRHWSFQRIKRTAVPKFTARDRVRTPIDAFLARDFRAAKLSFNPDAPKITLLRRLYFDLLGLPPTPEQTAAFLRDTSPEAYDRLIDELLASPQYGERWARHWLDIAGYADSDGYNELDAVRPYAYKYRDYVIRAFNEDKPFDQFVIEQLAGDELIPYPHKNLSPDQIEKLTATGFLRMAADGTGSSDVDQSTARNQVIADTIKIVSTSLLGLSVGCAQCHDHRYDPIPQTDYYRLRAVFEPAYDWKSWRTPPERLVSLNTDAERAKMAEIEGEAAQLIAERDRKAKEYITQALEEHLKKKYDPSTHEMLRTAFHAPSDKRTPEQKKLLQENPSLNITTSLLDMYDRKASDALKKMDAQLGEVRARKPPANNVHALTEFAGSAPVTYVFHRGDPKSPKQPINPGGLTVLSANEVPVEFPTCDAKDRTSGRRLAFARWIVSTNNPLLPRAIVNRLWLHHFGRGLVGTPADFGITGEKPSHPDLLDWLASEFVASGWSIKHVHRLILTSTAYRQSSARDSRKETLDADNRLYWRANVRRLDAEAIRDSILATAGILTHRPFGPAVPVREDIFGQVVVGIDKKEGDTKTPVEVPIGGEEFRRSIYVQVRRSQPLAVLTTFDAPVMEVNCENRPSSTVAPQSLMLMNSAFMLRQAAFFAQRAGRDAAPSVSAQIIRAFQLAYCRPPSDTELQRSLKFHSAQVDHLVRNTEQPSQTPVELQALTSLCQALFSSSEFLYAD